jgi:peroxin-2
MSSANFAAAQKRVLERRQRLELEAQTRLREQQRTSRLDSATLDRLPYPLNRLTKSGVLVWDNVKGRDGTKPVFRVGQVDAELLDEELLDLLKGQVGEALKYFGV